MSSVQRTAGYNDEKRVALQSNLSSPLAVTYYSSSSCWRVFAQPLNYVELVNLQQHVAINWNNDNMD